MDYPILELQVSQFYLSKEKIKTIKTWFNPNDLSNFTPVPIKKIGNRTFLTDGHSRAWIAYQSGLKFIPVIWEEEELNWDFYLACLSACEKRGVYTVADLTAYQLEADDYEKLWLGFCKKLLTDLQ